MNETQNTNAKGITMSQYNLRFRNEHNETPYELTINAPSMDVAALIAQKEMQSARTWIRCSIIGDGVYGPETERIISKATAWQKLNG